MAETVARQVSKVLFRFRSNDTKHSFEDELSKAINMHQIWCAPISVQNDPFDAYPVLTHTPESEMLEYRNALRKKYGPKISITGNNLANIAKTNGTYNKKLRKFLASDKAVSSLTPKLIVQVFQEVRQRAKIACFSEKLDSILMWSHYANSHEGVCLEYECPQKGTGYYVNHRLGSIQYSNVRPRLTELEAIKYLGYANLRDESFFTEEEHMEVLTRTLLTKSTQWEYEREWRWVEFNNNPNGYTIMLPMKVKSITVGVRASDTTIALCKEVIKAGKGVPIYKVKLSDSTFAFEREEI